jgi:hypothetical protein
MHEQDACEAGIAFATLEHRGTKEFSSSCPCFGPEQTGKCESKVYPTAEEMAADDARMAERFISMAKAREAIVAHCGGPWKRGKPGGAGTIDCPVCNGKESLQFSLSGYNGHVHARCKTADCVSWIE